MPNFPIKLAVIDDHKLFRKGLIGLIKMVNSNTKIVFEADDGVDMQKKINPRELPDIILIDVNMPHMDGFACVSWLKLNYPTIKTLIVSMVEKEETIIKMLKLGVKGYLCKDVEPDELAQAINSIARGKFYYTDFITGKLVHSLQIDETEPLIDPVFIGSHELEFIKLACSELTYAEVADKMNLSPKTVDGYRHAIFERFHIKTRVGMVLFAIKNGLITIDSISI